MAIKRLARPENPGDSPTRPLSKNVWPGSLSVEDALSLADRLNAAEQAGWPKGYDPVVISRYWNEILFTLDDELQRIQASTPELSGILSRQFMKAVNPSYAPAAQKPLL